MNSISLAFFTVLLMALSEPCMAAAQEAAAVFAAGVMPALFPMMVLAGLPMGGGKGHYSEKAQGSLLIGTVAFGFAAGSPAGARRIAMLQGQGRVSSAQAARLYITTGVMSPLFFLGSMTRWIQAPRACALLLGMHWLAALLTGAIGCLWLPGRAGRATQASRSFVSASSATSPPPTPSTLPPSSTAPSPVPSLLSLLPEAIAGAAQALLSVCGAMMLFSVLMAIIRGLCAWLLPAWAAGHPGLWSVLHSLLEVGGGAYAVIRGSLYLSEHSLALLCGLCSFGGLSIWMQNLTFAGESIRPLALLLFRAAHGAIAYGLCRIIFFFFPLEVKAFGGMVAQPLVILGDPLPRLGLLLGLCWLGIFYRRSKTCSPHS